MNASLLLLLLLVFNFFVAGVTLWAPNPYLFRAPTLTLPVLEPWYLAGNCSAWSSKQEETVEQGKLQHLFLQRLSQCRWVAYIFPYSHWFLCVFYGFSLDNWCKRHMLRVSLWDGRQDVARERSPAEAETGQFTVPLPWGGPKGIKDEGNDRKFLMVSEIPKD